jgi:branched-chain amino acid aminotransferase
VAGALEGITRDCVMRLAQELGHEVRECQLARSDLYLADECFLTGTAAGVVPLSAIDDRTIGAGGCGQVTAALANLLTDIATGRDNRHPEWREHV